MKKALLLLVVTGSYYGALAQSAYLPYDADEYHRVQRLEIRSGSFSPFFHSSVAPYSRRDMVRFADSFSIQGHPISFVDFQYLNYIQLDNPDWSGSESGVRRPVLNYFYPQQSAMIYHDQGDFSIRVNPVLNLQSGRDFARNENLYTNSRGVEALGQIGKKIGFYSYMTDNIVKAPYYLRQFSDSVGNYPTAGLTKTLGNNTYNFLQARGYITFSPIKDVLKIQFGNDRNFIGDGYRSFMFSDFGRAYLFLKINTKIWKFNYQNLYAQMVQPPGGGDINRSIKKYIAFHHLSYNITKSLNVGVFETIVFDRTDSTGYNAGFDANYLNPVIFYRSVEHGLNSSDNAMLGMNAKWNFLHHFQMYGQLTIDELKIDEYIHNHGWWGNKYAAQVGLKIIDALIPNLDLQYEFNTVRPYTFMHFKLSQNYTNFQTPIGHPSGANFREHIALLTYRPNKKWTFYGTYIFNQKGLDSDSLNWGGNIMTNTYNNYVSEYGNHTGQGALTNVNLIQLRLSYEVFHRMYLEAVWLYRDSRSPIPAYTSKTSMLSLGLRMNMARPRNLF
ncbi:MAG: hypothetical protein GC180_08715 [Bacteroidetes bacterium]|nr:hypothetical protein [Bacteroidota bacterium]